MGESDPLISSSSSTIKTFDFIATLCLYIVSFFFFVFAFLFLVQYCSGVPLLLDNQDDISTNNTTSLPPFLPLDQD